MGAKLIYSIIRENRSDILLSLSEDFFVDEEVRLYDFVSDYYHANDCLPSEEALSDNGFHPVSTPDAAGYYRDECKKRGVYNAVRTQNETLLNALQRRDVPEITGTLSSMLSNCTSLENATEVSGSRHDIDAALDAIADPLSGTGLLGVGFGKRTLDNITRGMQGGDLIVFAGRPNIGKSYQVLSCAYHAWLERHNALFVSMEMTRHQMLRRLIGMHTGLNPLSIQAGEISSIYESEFLDKVEELKDLPDIWMMEGSFRKTTRDIDSIIHTKRPEIVFIDAGYLIQPERQNKNRQRREVISETMEELKGIALHHDIPICTTVQFNRTVRRDTKNAPDLSSIAETDTIGQIASIVIAIMEGPTGFENTTRTLSIIKNREGPVNDSIYTNFQFEPMSFGELTEEQVELIAPPPENYDEEFEESQAEWI